MLTSEKSSYFLYQMKHLSSLVFCLALTSPSSSQEIITEYPSPTAPLAEVAGDLEVREISSADQSGNLWVDNDLFVGKKSRNILSELSGFSAFSGLQKAEYRGTLTLGEGSSQISNYYFSRAYSGGSPSEMLIPLGRVSEWDACEVTLSSNGYGIAGWAKFKIVGRSSSVRQPMAIEEISGNQKNRWTLIWQPHVSSTGTTHSYVWYLFAKMNKGSNTSITSSDVRVTVENHGGRHSPLAFADLSDLSVELSNVYDEASSGAPGRIHATPNTFNGPVIFNDSVEINGSSVLTRDSGGAASATGFAGGTATEASGDNAFAFGASAKAVADNSNAFGTSTHAGSASQFVVGEYNELWDSQSSPETERPLFVVGNGSDIERSNALEVRADGTTTVSGDLNVQNGALEVERSIRAGWRIYANSAKIGDRNIAGSNSSLSVGKESHAGAEGSVAVGDSWAKSTATHSAAFGLETTTVFPEQFAVGRYNDPGTYYFGSPAGGMSDNTPVFMVGIGSEDGQGVVTKRNALTVNRDGKIWVNEEIDSHDVTVRNRLYVQGDVSIDANFAGGGISSTYQQTSVGGNVTIGDFDSQATINGDVSLTKAQGDIPMGIYGNE